MPYRITSQPAEEPVTLAEAKAHLRVDDTADDALVNALIVAARQQVEGWTNRALVTQDWELSSDSFPRFCDNQWIFDERATECDTIRLPLGNLDEDTVEITYVDVTGVTRTLAPSLYQIDAASEPARLIPAYASYWPIVRCPQLNAVTVAFTAGYGTAADVPQSIKQAILLLIGHLYENRTETAEMPKAVGALLDPYRLFY
jgi:uncharacterized phiE125 gp8 family phage protein